jgi:hypothetical protein
MPLVFGALALAAVFSILGAVMGDTHEPVAIEPDAKLAAGTQVATFALG